LTPTGLNRRRLLAHLGLMRELVRGMCIDWGVSIRGACGILQFDTSTFPSTSRRTDQAAVARRIRRSARDEPSRHPRSEPDAIGVRYGYRRRHVLLRREGWVITIKKTRRIYTELALQIRNRNPKLRVQGWGAAH
jgi:putative transposase